MSNESIPPILDYNFAKRLYEEPILPSLIEPILVAERNRLNNYWSNINKSSICFEQVTDDAISWLEKLIARLTNEIVASCFTAYRLTKNPLWRPKILPPGRDITGYSCTIVSSFISSSFGKEIIEGKGCFSALGSLLTSVRNNWYLAVTEIIERTITSISDIEASIDPVSGAIGQICSIKFGLSDPHDGGRTVCQIIFDSGTVIYKPRSLKNELTWDSIFSLVLSSGLNLSHRKLRSLNYDKFGFSEYIEPLPCKTLQEASNCYKRYGAIIAVAHALGTTDLHRENIIVAGEFPIVVDAETLFPGKLAPNNVAHNFVSNASMAGIRTFPTVYELGILSVRISSFMTQSEKNIRQQLIDVGALSYSGIRLRGLVPCATASDELSFRIAEIVDTFPSHLPRIEAQIQKPDDFSDEIIEGFSKAYSFIESNRLTILNSITGTSKHRIRVVPRPTLIYESVLSRSLHLDTLASDSDRMLHIEEDLSYLSSLRLDVAQEIVNHEAKQLFIGDIPHFEVDVSSQKVYEIPLETSPENALKERLESLSTLDYDLQIASIELSLRHPSHNVFLESQALDEAVEAEVYAVGLLNFIARTAQKDGEVVWWPFITQMSDSPSARVHADTNSLYDGGAGTAMVLGEAGAFLGQSEWRDLALLALLPIASGKSPLGLSRGAGLARGMGGLAYAMGRAGRALDNEELIDFGIRLIVENGCSLSEAENFNDLLSGRAGILMASLLLYSIKNDLRLLDVSDKVATHISDSAQITNEGVFWSGPLSSAPEAHVAHGGTGIAVALARWASLRGISDFNHLISGSFQWEDRYWSSTQNGWLLQSGMYRGAVGWNWCMGRAGSLTARAIASKLLNLDLDESKINAAISSEPSGPLQHPSLGLCCGTAGVLDSLITLQKYIDSKYISDKVHMAKSLLISEESKQKIHPLFCSPFSGCAGTALALLRSTYSDQIPSLVWFE